MKDKTKTLLTAEMQIKPSNPAYKELDNELFLSKNLYNTFLYTERQLYFAKQKCTDPEEKAKMKGFISDFDLITEFRHTNNRDYRALPSAVAAQTCMQAYNNYISFFNLNKKDPKARPPKYLDSKKGRFKLSYIKGAFSKSKLKKGTIKLSGLKCTFKFPDYIDHDAVQQIDIVKTQNRTIKILIMYAVPKVPLKEDNGRVLGVDLGVDNLMSVVSNTDDFKPRIYDGKPLKAINQFCNKQVANLKSLSKNVITEKICSVFRNRMNQVNDCFHKYSSDLINQAVSNGFNTVIIGKNDNWKQEVNLGTRNNQNFVSIPFDKLISKIKYKASLKGIKVIETEESYTSKCSFFDNEYPCKHESYLGERVHRGLFRSSKGFINADLNGALNIIKKVVKDFSCETANLSIDFFKTIVKVSPKFAV